MDTNLTAQEKQQIQTAIDAFSSQKGFAADDTKDLFCEHWEKAKSVLNVIKKFLPAPIPAIIDILIGIGDQMHESCPANP